MRTEPHPVVPDVDYSPWTFAATASDEEKEGQRRYQAVLRDGHPGRRFGRDCFVSRFASVQCEELHLGDRTYVAAHAYLTGAVSTGRDCTINVHSVVRGDVEIGDGVRIGAHTSILGFNHTISDPEVEVFRQPLTSQGIRIGSDVWIGSHVVVLDGVSVGDRAVLAAGAVVTRPVPPGAIVGGNPARVLKWRVGGPPSAGAHDELGGRLMSLAETARAEARALLARCWDADAPGGRFVDRPGAAPTVRAHCDAVEIADLLLGRPPEQLPPDEHRSRLLGLQDPATGLVPEFGGTAPTRIPDSAADPAGYHVLAVGYALQLLGTRFRHPLSAIAAPGPAELLSYLDGLPWRERAWSAGHLVDMLGTALRWQTERGDPGARALLDALFGWLGTHADPRTGLWGGDGGPELLQPVNGFYRASRGTYAQFGLPLPYPERVIDSVLAHAGQPRLFAPDRQNACNVLDVAHPLWLAGRQTGHRRDEVVTLAASLLNDATGRWVAREGFSFRAPYPGGGADPATVPGLQGTEMWLAIIWVLADLLGLADVVGYLPRGVHRPEPALRPIAV